MPRKPSRQPAYKELTFQQLRSFYETARKGSLTAAAASLGLAQPTVWKQVHALESELGTQLIEAYGRGCRLTEAGRVLADLAAPPVLSIAALKRHFDEACRGRQSRLTVATTPRSLVEDLPAVVVEFEKRFPNVHLTLKEMPDERVSAVVERGEADLGLTPERAADPKQPWQLSPWLVFEPAYELDIVLITPKKHPLARRRSVRPSDLRGFPLVNGPTAFPDVGIIATLDKLGVFEAQPRRVEAFYAAAIRKYVELGFGIGLIGTLPNRRQSPKLHERSMSRYFGRPVIYLVRRKGIPETAACRAFAETVKASLRDK
jgi:DNA-binding transcriptional LysR family regulator